MHTTTRREFLHLSIGSAAALSVLAVPHALARPPADAKLKILILGGTGFLGPHCSESALARGHSVTLFNRGRTEDRRKKAGRPSAVPAGVEVLYGNRDPNKTADADNDESKGESKDPNSPKGLAQLAGKTWDAVIDTSGYWPRMVKASAELLASSARQYLFISSLSAYRNNAEPDKDETDALATLSDPSVEDFGADFANYGGGKALCEAAAEAAMPGRATILRPGFIVGPRDTSARFLYWPLRASKGGEMIVPGSPDDPIQIVDVRDLADFIIRCLETNALGAYNVTGARQPYSMKALVEGCAKGVATDATGVWIEPEFLQSKGLQAQASFPLWISGTGEDKGFHRRSIAKALAAGLTFRPLTQTAKDTLDWHASLPDDLRNRIAPPLLDPERERSIIAEWKKRG